MSKAIELAKEFDAYIETEDDCGHREWYEFSEQELEAFYQRAHREGQESSKPRIEELEEQLSDAKSWSDAWYRALDAQTRRVKELEAKLAAIEAQEPVDVNVGPDAPRAYRTFDDMCWAVPGQRMDDLEYRMRYATKDAVFTMSERLTIASFLSAYREIVRLPQKERNERIKEIRQGPNASLSGRGEPD